MDQEIQVLAPELVHELTDMLAWWRTKKSETKHRPPEPLIPTPDVYVSRAPQAGIPARQDDPGSGCAGSGTSSSIADVFYVMCDCFLIDDSVSSDVDVVKIHRQLPVWNIGAAAIPGHAPLLAVRDKTGKWIAMQPAGGAGAGTLFVFFTLASTLATTDANQSGCTVNSYFGGASPGSTITVYNVPASTNYVFSGASGHKGIAVYDGAKFLILQMECP